MASTEKIGWRLLIFCCLYYLMCDHNASGSELDRLVLSKTPETITRMNDAFPADLDGQSAYNRSVFINQQCQRDLLATIKARDEEDEWAWLALDAAGVVGPGIIEGNTNYLGNYKECQRVKASNKTYEIHVGGKTIQHVHAADGKYCRVYWKDTRTNNNYVFRTRHLISKGDCVPSSCSEQDIFLIYSLGNNGLPVRLVYCDKPLDFSTDHSAIIGLTILLIFIALVLVATFTQVAVESYNKKTSHVDEQMIAINGKDVVTAETLLTGTDKEVDIKPNKPSRVLQVLYSFSLVKNLPALLTTEDTSRTYSSLNGLRFLAMVWIVYGHSFFIYDDFQNYMSMVENTAEASRFLQVKPFVINTDLGVDIFFVLSATLMTLSFLKTLEKGNGNLTWRQLGYHYLHRWIRITPLYMFVIILYACLFRYIASGPQPREFMEDVNCRRNWWVNLLFLQNVFRAEEACASWTWYIANDVWFYCISPLSIYMLYRYRKCGIAILVLWIFGHFALKMAIAALSSPDIDAKEWFFTLYIPPWMRSGEYAVGVLAGYVLFKNKFQLNMHKALQIFLWLLCFAAFLAVMFAHVRLIRLYKNDIMAWVVTWLVIVSISGRAGWVNAALSWKLFVPLSRITYTGYLIHPIVIQYHILFRTRPLYMENNNMVFISSGYLLMTAMLAVPVTLMFEIPFMELEKLLIPKPKPPTVEVCKESSKRSSINIEPVEVCNESSKRSSINIEPVEVCNESSKRSSINIEPVEASVDLSNLSNSTEPVEDCKKDS